MRKEISKESPLIEGEKKVEWYCVELRGGGLKESLRKTVETEKKPKFSKF
jgi:hypothetical protein